VSAIRESFSKWIYNKQDLSRQFEWQIDFEAFTISPSQLQKTLNAIKIKKKSINLNHSKKNISTF
jgi:hypothetical protein